MSLGILSGAGIFITGTYLLFGTWLFASPVSDGFCNIAVIPVHGEIYSYSTIITDEFGTVFYEPNTPESVRSALSRISEDENIQGILVSIDSPGGSPAGSETITKLIQKSTLPTVAFTGDIAASGGYMIATGADTIISSAFSDIGSIGITMSYLDTTKQNEQDGLTYVELTSAPHKDYLLPDRTLTESEKTKVSDDLKIYHDVFVDMIATHRNMSKEQVAALADGFSMPAITAQKNGLIDSIGDIDTVRSWFAEKLTMSIDDIIICETEVI